MELKKVNKIKDRVQLVNDLLGPNGFSRDWIADLIGFNKNIIRKEKINKIYEQ